MITIKREPECITIKGHAGYAPAGEDIVCCAISVLFQTMLLSFEQLTTDQITYRAIPGDSRLQYRNLSEKGHLLIDSFFVGVQAIEEAYPQYVQMTKH